jgi:hypothetical protein
VSHDQANLQSGSGFDKRGTRGIACFGAPQKTAQALALRARIVLRCAEGKTHLLIAEELAVSNVTVGKWRQRFVEKRLEGLQDEPRPGQPRKISDEDVPEVPPAPGQINSERRWTRDSFGDGQLRDSQNTCRQTMVPTPSGIPRALHTYQRKLA